MARLDTKGWVTLVTIGLSLLFAASEVEGAQRSARGAETTQTAQRKRSSERAGTVQKRFRAEQARGSTSTSDGRPERTETKAVRGSSARAGREQARATANAASRNTPSSEPGSRRSSASRSSAERAEATRASSHSASRARPAPSNRSTPDRAAPTRRDRPSVQKKPAKHRQQAPKRYERPAYHRGPTARPGPVVRVHIDFNWPWVFRQRRRWAPRYQYRQVVFVEAGWGRRRHTSRVDVRTYYRHRVQHATPHRADVDILIDRIELYENGHYLGAVEHIPDHLGRLRATLYRDGRVVFDRNIFLVGDARVGFEMISTRHYDGFILNAYRPQHGVKVGALNLRWQRVEPVRYSRLFDPYHFEGYVPISLVPEDQDWLCDYGQRAASARYYSREQYDDDRYYYGRLQDEPGNASQGVYSSRSPEVGRSGAFEMDSLSDTRDEQFRTDRGADIHLQRTVELKRIE